MVNPKATDMVTDCEERLENRLTWSIQVAHHDCRIWRIGKAGKFYWLWSLTCSHRFCTHVVEVRAHDTENLALGRGNRNEDICISYTALVRAILLKFRIWVKLIIALSLIVLICHLSGSRIDDRPFGKNHIAIESIIPFRIGLDEITEHAKFFGHLCHFFSACSIQM